jgi:cellulose synthase/poly-beta-1,6-N-acetylglucosamine synthase-like glycosyltransferase
VKYDTDSLLIKGNNSIKVNDAKRSNRPQKLMNSINQTSLIPVYYEEESVEKLITRIVEVGKQIDFAYEIIIVDDGSTDNTWQIVKA